MKNSFNHFQFERFVLLFVSSTQIIASCSVMYNIIFLVFEQVLWQQRTIKHLVGKEPTD